MNYELIVIEFMKYNINIFFYLIKSLKVDSKMI